MRTRPVGKVGRHVRSDQRELVLLEVAILPAFAHPLDHELEGPGFRLLLLVHVRKVAAFTLGRSEHGLRDTLMVREESLVSD